MTSFILAMVHMYLNLSGAQSRNLLISLRKTAAAFGFQDVLWEVNEGGYIILEYRCKEGTSRALRGMI